MWEAVWAWVWTPDGVWCVSILGLMFLGLISKLTAWLLLMCD